MKFWDIIEKLYDFTQSSFNWPVGLFCLVLGFGLDNAIFVGLGIFFILNHIIKFLPHLEKRADH